jgi:hypothetical protein
MQLPPVGGFSGTVTFTAVGAPSFPAGATVTLQSFLTRPPGAPAPQGARRRPNDDAPTGYGYVQWSIYSSSPVLSENQSYNVSLPGPPLSSYTANTYDDFNGLVVQSVPGVYGSGTGSVTFPVSTTIYPSSGTTYTTEFVANSKLPTPTPTPSPAPTATVPGATPTPTPVAGAQTVYWTPFHVQPSYQLAFAPLPLTASSSHTEVAGTAGNRLNCTTGMTVDQQGRLWILSNPSGCSVPFATTAEVFIPPITSSSTPAYAFPLTGTGRIDHVIFDKSGNLWASDQYNRAVYEYTGPFPTSRTLSPALTLTSGITVPGGVAVDASGNVYVSLLGSSGTKSIAVFRTPLSNTTTPTYLNGLTHPAGLRFDSAGNLYASSNPAGSPGSIVRYSSTNLGNGAMPDIINAVGGTSADYGANFAFDAAGNLYDADCGGHGRIMVFPTGTALFTSLLAPSVTYTNTSITPNCIWGIAVL